MQEDQYNLKPGTTVDKYKIIRVLGEGGFGITYLAEDIHLGLKVVIKEYFPNEFAMRSSDSTITAKSKSINDFSKGKQRFKEEAQILAKFNHPSIVKILGYFEANDTAYFVMEYEEGIDLAQLIKQKGKPFSQDEIIAIIMPILEGLKEVHRHNYLHRDIKPANILIRQNKQPVLIDFGATRVAVNEDQSKSVTSMLTEGYAPFEQYSTDMKQQGAFTDIYAIGAVLYKMITMKTPVASQTRAFQEMQNGHDPLEKLSSMNPQGIDSDFLKAIDKAMEIKPRSRQQSVEELQENLMGRVQQKESVKTEEKIAKYTIEDNEPSGLGGWLTLIGVWLMISLLNYLWIPLVRMDNFQYMSANRIIFDSIGNIVFLFLHLYLIYLFFAKKYNFVQWFISVAVLSIIYGFAFAFFFYGEDDFSDMIIVTIMIIIVWFLPPILYLRSSMRVIKTFIKPINNTWIVLGVIIILSIIMAAAVYVMVENKQQDDTAVVAKANKEPVVKEKIKQFELNRYKRDGDVVYDTKTNLMWQDNSEPKNTKKTWKDAKRYCQDLSFSAYNDWRLPAYSELYHNKNPGRYAKNILPFKNVSSYYWTSSSVGNNPNATQAWYVLFDPYLYVGISHKNNYNYVRCVRDE